MTDSKKKQQKSASNTENPELDNILDQLSERNDADPAAKVDHPAEEEIIKKPLGLDEQPEDLEGMLEKISETPPKAKKPQGFFQRLLSFFR